MLVGVWIVEYGFSNLTAPAGSVSVAELRDA
jgi:hypothetical protein